MSEEEQQQVSQLSEFILLFYVKYWFMTPLAGSAARNDLDFMSGILEYRKVKPVLAWDVLHSAYGHLWYLTPQLVILALCDKGLEKETR